MAAECPQGDDPLIPIPTLSLAALRQAVAAVAPSRLPEFFQEIQDAFTQAGDEDSVFPIRHFYQRWGTPIERQPSVAAERALADPDPAVRDQAIREAAEIVQAVYREVTCGAGNPVTDDLIDCPSAAALAAVLQVAEEM